MGKPAVKSRARGTIRQRGNSYQVIVYAGVDPVTKRRLYLRESTSDPREAERILTRLCAHVDEQRHAKTNATFRAAMQLWLKTHEIEASTRESYETYARLHFYPVFGDEPAGRITAQMLEEFYAELRRCANRCDGKPFVAHRVSGPHECRAVKHRYPPGRPPAGGRSPHDCAERGCVVVECQPHTCVPLSAATIRRMHFAIRGVLSAAERWGWITSNPAKVARKPRPPASQPEPPSVEDAARIAEAAWEEDAAWGTLVWLVMVTGVRRAELLALRWTDIDLTAGKISVRRNYIRANRESFEKDTKTHQMRRMSIDSATVEVLQEHHARYVAVCESLGVPPRRDAFVFSYRPEHDRPCDPSGVTHRYDRMCQRLGIDSHLHALRHYSATELLTAGVDLRTVAGRLGHGGGGATTLKVYAAWVNESDRRAAEILGGRMKRPHA